ncbi:MAG: SPOR domain-containing protein [Dissulfurimicrobium sp.]|uniref:SPOR domain-containing protein n=1 Tax=Dissulfurimicrobium TaxID=1769732 RepID=UPI001EDA09F5|nr:SPOR domain-containing protein [Dissulfurimicrobium hydrothermale]UKL14055.1 SPOR domain-containing protein [Dissulfurimicrobium hydrothermale]
MARTERTGKKIQFQLSWGGLAAVAISTICVLLWAFVLGFWSGKKVAEKNAALIMAQQPKQTAQAQPAARANENLPPQGQGQQEAREAGGPETQQPTTFQANKEAQGLNAAAHLQQASEKGQPQGAAQLQQPAATPEAASSSQTGQAENGPTTKAAAGEGAKEAGKAKEIETRRPEKAAKQGYEVKKIETTTRPNGHTKAAAETSHERNKAAQTGVKTALVKPQNTAPTHGKGIKEAEGAYYALQIGAFKDKKNAELELVRLDAKGYKARIKVTDTGTPNGTLHRVYLGRFKTPEEAKAFAKTLHDKDGIDSYVIFVKE